MGNGQVGEGRCGAKLMKGKLLLLEVMDATGVQSHNNCRLGKVYKPKNIPTQSSNHDRCLGS